MVVSEVFRTEVFNKAFKGYRYDSTMKRVDTRLGLDFDSRLLLVKRFGEFGFSSEDEAEEAINGCLSSSNRLGLRERKETKLCFVNLSIGASLVLERDYDITLSLLYLGNFKFFVISDGERVLPVGNIIQSVEKGATKGKEAHFWIFEKGRFPLNPRKVYSTGKISSILWAPPFGKPTSVTLPVLVSKKIVYAWKPSVIVGETAFEARDITNNKRALFQINLDDCTFCINPDFDADSIIGYNLFDDFLIPVSDEVVYDRTRAVNIDNLRKESGLGNLVFIDETMSLRVEKKISIIKL